MFINKFATAIALVLATIPQMGLADLLIERNWLSSGQDWYLMEDKVRQVEPNIFMALHYLTLNRPQDSLEIFNDDFEVVGVQKIGTYRSYQYLSFFDCKKQLVADYGTRYFSAVRPSKEHLVYKEIPDSDRLYYSLPRNQKLLNRVCSIGRAK